MVIIMILQPFGVSDPTQSKGCRVPRGMGSLKELQILEEVDIKRTSWKAIKELGELTHLRKLAVEGRGAPKKKCKAFCETASNLYSLRSLNVRTKNPFEEDGVLDMLVSFTSPLPSLERLKLEGRLQKLPSWIGKSMKLVKIDLQFCELKELDALAQLPNLLQLRLYYKAYAAEKLVFCRDAFAKMRILLLQDHNLREVTFEQSTSPNLEKISIEDCQLTSGITGIEHLPKLREIFISGCILANQDILKEEANKHMNHPVLQIRRCEEPGVKVEVIRESISEAGESSQS
jgi:disease resistance protein RPM1